MNEKQLRLMQQITKKNLLDKTLECQKSVALANQHNKQYTQLKKYYQEYLNDNKNKDHQAQNATLLSNTHHFLSHLQRMLMLQRSAVNKYQSLKERCRIEWKKQQAKRKRLKYLKCLEWEEEEEEELEQEAKNILRKD